MNRKYENPRIDLVYIEIDDVIAFSKLAAFTYLERDGAIDLGSDNEPTKVDINDLFGF